MNKYFGNKNFYKKTLTIAVPIMIQNGLTNFVGLLDNIMVGQVGTEEMSGIAIVNQLLFIFNLAIFGAVAGAGIYTAQFYGKSDHKGIQHSFRFKLYICIIISVIGILLFLNMGGDMIMQFLRGEENGLSLDAALYYGKDYMRIMLIGLIPFALEQAYSGTLRECGETVVSMKAGMVAIGVNLILNYVLIFGKLGMPVMGVEGAAIATVVSRYIQFIIVVAWTHTHKERMPFIKGVYRSWSIPLGLTAKIALKGAPLLVNETLWSGGMAMINQCYSLRGLDAIAAMNISTTITNLFNVAFIALGDAIAIVVGQQLGAGEFEEAKDTDRKLIVFSGLVCVGLGIMIYLVSPMFPEFYNTTEGVKELATSFMRVSALFIPVWGLTHAIYFTLRSGGKTFITFLFDSVYMWTLVYTVAYLLSRKTSMNVVYMYFCVQCVDIVKVIIGALLVRKGIWVNNIVADDN